MMNEVDFQSYLEKHEDQALAKVLVAWHLIGVEAVRESYQEMQRRQAAGEHCKLGQILIQKRLIQISDYTRAMQAIRQQLQILYQKSSSAPTAQIQTTPSPQPSEVRTKPVGSSTQARQSPQNKTETKITRAPEVAETKQLENRVPGPSPAAHEKATAIPGQETSLGKYFGGYEVICEIARGGMGIVYKARQHPLNRLVALKVLLSGGAASEIEIERFRREAESAGALQHPNIVSIYEIGEQDGYHYFTMDFIEGVTLQEMIKKKSRLKKLVQIMEKVALALDHAHRRGVVHRDIKPSNILVSQDGDPKITDFGLAKKLDANTMLTESGAALGTPFYMAPEQTLGSRDVDARVDIYAMGVILYEILAGRLPFTADTLVDLYRKIVEEDPVLPGKLSRKVEKELETICLKAMEKDPNLRYQTAQEFAEDLQRYLSGNTISAKRTSVFYRIHRKIKRARQRIAVAGGIAVVLLSVILLVVLKMTEKSEEEKKREKAEILVREGEALAKNEKFDEGMAKWDEAIQIDPQCYKAYYARGNALQKRHQYWNAITEYDQLLRTRPNDALAYFGKGKCYTSLEKWDKAIEFYSKAIQNNLPHKTKIEAYHYRAKAYENRKQDDDWQKAIQDFNTEESLKKEKEQ